MTTISDLGLYFSLNQIKDALKQYFKERSDKQIRISADAKVALAVICQRLVSETAQIGKENVFANGKKQLTVRNIIEGLGNKLTKAANTDEDFIMGGLINSRFKEFWRDESYQEEENEESEGSEETEETEGESTKKRVKYPFKSTIVRILNEYNIVVPKDKVVEGENLGRKEGNVPGKFYHQLLREVLFEAVLDQFIYMNKNTLDLETVLVTFNTSFGTFRPSETAREQFIEEIQNKVSTYEEEERRKRSQKEQALMEKIQSDPELKKQMEEQEQQKKERQIQSAEDRLRRAVQSYLELVPNGYSRTVSIVKEFAPPKKK